MIGLFSVYAQSLPCLLPLACITMAAVAWLPVVRGQKKIKLLVFPLPAVFHLRLGLPACPWCWRPAGGSANLELPTRASSLRGLLLLQSPLFPSLLTFLTPSMAAAWPCFRRFLSWPLHCLLWLLPHGLVLSILLPSMSNRERVIYFIPEAARREGTEDRGRIRTASPIINFAFPSCLGPGALALLTLKLLFFGHGWPHKSHCGG